MTTAPTANRTTMSPRRIQNGALRMAQPYGPVAGGAASRAPYRGPGNGNVNDTFPDGYRTVIVSYDPSEPGLPR